MMQKLEATAVVFGADMVDSTLDVDIFLGHDNGDHVVRLISVRLLDIERVDVLAAA